MIRAGTAVSLSTRRPACSSPRGDPLRHHAQGYRPGSRRPRLRDSLHGSQVIPNLSLQAGTMIRHVRASLLIVAVGLVLFVTAEAVGGGSTSIAATTQFSAFRSHAVNS